MYNEAWLNHRSHILYSEIQYNSNNMEVLHTAQSLLAKIPFNAFDYILIASFVLYLYEEVAIGARAAFSHTIAIITAFFIGLFSYSILSKLFILYFSFSKGISDAVSFLLLTVIFYFVTSKTIYVFSKKASGVTPKRVSKTLALLSGVISFTLITAFIIALFLSFPVAPSIKSTVKNSVFGGLFLTKTQNIEQSVKQIFGDTIDETLNFLTVKPDSESTVDLHFTTTDVTIDKISESTMIQLVNEARKKQGLTMLKSDPSLKKAALLHAKDMFKRGYFSHYTPEGYSPFARLEEQGIIYTAAAENLAYAPEVELAFSGLMKSPGHKKNILDPMFRKIGIGVLDGGIYGKMFVQEFTD